MDLTTKFFTNLYLKAASELGLGYEIIDKNKGLVIVKNAQKRVFIRSNKLDINLALAAKVAKDKFLSGQILSKENIPIPKAYLFDLDSLTIEQLLVEINKIKNKLGKIVIKPHDSSLGKGVYVNPENSEDFIKAIEVLISYGKKKILVEKMLEGTDYRIILVNGECIDILRRLHAFVIGNGISTIKHLIEEKNKFRQENGFKLINVDKEMKDFLAEKDLTVDSIPQNNERIILRKVCNFSKGGEVERIPLENIHTKYIKMFENITKASQLAFIGVDLITEDITEDPYTNRSGINEINSAPMFDINQFADIKESKPLFTTKLVLQKIFS